MGKVPTASINVPYYGTAHFGGQEVQYSSAQTAYVVKLSDEATEKLADAIVRRLKNEA